MSTCASTVSIFLVAITKNTKRQAQIISAPATSCLYTHLYYPIRYLMLCCAVLCCAVLCCAVLCCAVLSAILHVLIICVNSTYLINTVIIPQIVYSINNFLDWISSKITHQNTPSRTLSLPPVCQNHLP